MVMNAARPSAETGPSTSAAKGEITMETSSRARICSMKSLMAFLKDASMICRPSGTTTIKEDLFFALIEREQQRDAECLEHALQGAVKEFKETIGNDMAAAIRLVLDTFVEINPPDRTSFMVERELELIATRDPQVARIRRRTFSTLSLDTRMRSYPAPISDSNIDLVVSTVAPTWTSEPP